MSRAGKTPTRIYLALHHGVSAANYPLTDEDLEHDRLPPRLRAHRSKLFGLTIDPVRLHQIRQERRPDSRYASLETCKREVAAAEKLFRAERIPVLSTTHVSMGRSRAVMSTGHRASCSGGGAVVRGPHAGSAAIAQHSGRRQPAFVILRARPALHRAIRVAVPVGKHSQAGPFAG